MNASKSASQQLALPASRINCSVSLGIAGLRAQLTALTFLSPYLSEAERLLANHHIHECEDKKRLQVWLRNVAAELAWREAAYYGQCHSPNMRPSLLTIHS